MAKADELLGGLVPEAQPDGFEAAPQRHALGAAQLGNGIVASSQAVARNLASEMVDVMETDRSGEPVQDARQIVERAALESGGVDVPLTGGPPVGVLELVLHIEQPDPDGAADSEHRELHQ